jgi:hypothetical protein
MIRKTKPDAFELIKSSIDEELTNEGCFSKGIMIMGTASPACY